MSQPLESGRSRQVALALLVVLLLAIGGAIAVPVWMLNRHYDTALTDALGKLDRYRRIAATRPALARQLEAMRSRDPRKFFLRSGPPALSAAEAQEAIRSIVESGGGRLITMQAPASKEEGHYRHVTVNVQLTANILALRRILAGIDGHVPFLFVDNLMVRTQVPSNFRPNPGVEPEMFVQFDVSGYAPPGS